MEHWGSALAMVLNIGRADIVKFLVENGVDANIATPGKYTSLLTLAAVSEHADMVEFLIERGADPNMPLQAGEYGSALIAAAYVGCKGGVEVLVKGGAKVDLKVDCGDFSTALEAAEASIWLEERDFLCWDKEDEKTLSLNKAEVADLLRRYAGGSA
ncbi:hypothetical protein C8A03DRAFT_36397 [Achaetomium macrosporum]|uniref:Ankyrin n=1 Tax=Achaetomium macrosporum TaxID=79813 RepID=A0AAN7C6M5_9PEZI|nr:hypothetical protein C8A03DRAFT_36397 [Achaetomium macrosporum]